MKTTIVFTSYRPTQLIREYSPEGKMTTFLDLTQTEVVLKDILSWVNSSISNAVNMIDVKELVQGGISHICLASKSVVCEIEPRDYYIPAMGSEVFKISLPKVTALKKKHEIYLFVEIENRLYPLVIGHVAQSGLVCLGQFNEVFDIKCAREYFIKLIEFPMSHANEVKHLRDIESRGASFFKQFIPISLASLIRNT